MNKRQEASIVSSKRLGDLLTDVEEQRLVVRPFFQRRLVWNNSVKDAFLDTVLNNYPFPEIFVALGESDPTKLKRKQWLVDGQQRISALRQYVLGVDSDIWRKVKPYAELTPQEKEDFSNYPVAVRDLGIISEAEIKEVFSRINSTDYSLKAIERLNALFSGPFKVYCENLAVHKFFEDHRVFTMTDLRRMRDLDFCVILVITMLSTYYHRDEKNREYLARYNNAFPAAKKINARLKKVFALIDKCGLKDRSRAWKKTDLLTLLVETDALINRGKKKLDAKKVGARVEAFYEEVDALYKEPGDAAPENTATSASDVATYLKAATKATNDKYSREIRAEIINRVIVGRSSSAKM